jgi:hypothetical protein
MMLLEMLVKLHAFRAAKSRCSGLQVWPWHKQQLGIDIVSFDCSLSIRSIFVFGAIASSIHLPWLLFLVSFEDVQTTFRLDPVLIWP